MWFFGHLPFQFSHTIKQEKNLLDFISLISKKMFVCLPNVSFISLRIHVKSPSLILCSKSKSRSCSSNASMLSSKFNRCKKDSIVYFSMRILSVENGSTYTNKNWYSLMSRTKGVIFVFPSSSILKVAIF